MEKQDEKSDGTAVATAAPMVHAGDEMASPPVHPMILPQDSILGGMVRAIGGEVLHTLPLGSVSEKILLYQMLHSDGDGTKAIINVPIKVHAWAMKASAIKVSPNGETSRWVVTFLLLDDSSVITCHSMGIAESIMQLSEIYGKCPWVPSIDVICRAKDLDNGKQFCYLSAPVPGKKQPKPR